MSDPGERHPRHIRIGRRDDDRTRHPLHFQDRVSLPRAGRPMPVLLVLAVLVILVGIVGSRYLRDLEREPSPPVPAPEATTFGPLAPAGEADADALVLRWSAHPRAEGYELRIDDGEGRNRWMARVGAQTELRLPADVAASLEAGAVYVWRVTALPADGDPEESRALAFVVR
jgi:hypothetical protein